MSSKTWIVVAALVLGVLNAPVSAHVERPSQFPPGLGSVPTYRKSGPLLFVCRGRKTAKAIRKLPRGLERRNERWHAKCQDHGYRNLQAAVDHVVEQGSRIKILPGIYREKPTQAEPTGACADLATQRPISYEQQLQCPHLDNLVSILGDSADQDIVCDQPVCHLQIEGTGKEPEDVIVDGGFHKLNAIRADRADGIYFRNFTVQNTEFNSIYVIETDGYAIDRMVGRWNDEYGFLTFASDHGLYTDCEAYGNGDGGLYPGSAADTPDSRWSVEIRNCDTHHNLIGISGTAANDLYVHDNLIHHNTLGGDEDSLFPGHPGMPQDGSEWVDNLFYSNNQDYNKYWEDGTCANIDEARKRYPEGVVCPSLPAPVGTGLLLMGANANTVENNYFYDNWRAGAFQIWIPAELRGEHDPSKQHDTSHDNIYRNNTMGLSPTGEVLPNGVDFYWDIEGSGNCWENNTAAPGKTITSDPPDLPDCSAPKVMYPGPFVSLYASCATWTKQDHNPPGCDWTERPPQPS
jgi:hypothetical protein